MRGFTAVLSQLQYINIRWHHLAQNLNDADEKKRQRQFQLAGDVSRGTPCRLWATKQAF
jgi:hypothetical protein